MEAISEAASSHSVGSDLDNENDNLSDMVSANVSGRGTPNVSGRDTPISQADSQLEGPEERQAAPDLPVTVQKTNREDVTDRFGKFDIKQELESDSTFQFVCRIRDGVSVKTPHPRGCVGKGMWPKKSSFISRIIAPKFPWIDNCLMVTN